MCSRVRVLLPLLAFCLVGPANGSSQGSLAKLSPELKVLYQAQSDRDVAGMERATALVAGRPPGSGVATKALGDRPERLSLLVKFSGRSEDLEAAGFRQQGRLGSIVTGTLETESLRDLLEVPGVLYVEPSRLLWAQQSFDRPRRVDSATQSSRFDTTFARSVTGAGAIVAFIDTGVDIFHHDVRDASGQTRIKALLDFSIPGDVDDDGILDGPGPFGGTLFTESEINSALSAGTFASVDSTGHGTHGLSVAAGDDPTFPGVAPAADIVVVKATRRDGSLGFESMDVINALQFIDDEATAAGQPYVVNLSLGTAFSSHDGRSLEEQAIDSLVGAGVAGKAVVVAAGNSSENGTTHFHHMSGVAYAGLASTHHLTVPAYVPNPEDGDDHILLDLWYGGGDELAIEVMGPAACGAPLVTALFGMFQDVSTGCGDIFIANVGGANPENGDVEAIVLIDDFTGTPPAVGQWEVRLIGQSIGESGAYDGWLVDGFQVGATSAFLSTAGDDHRMMVGKPGSAYNAITVGSYALHAAGTRFRTSWTDVNGIGRVDTTASSGELSIFSSPGPTRDGRRKPELTAPGERVMGAVSRDAWPGVSPSSIFRIHPWFPVEPEALLTRDTVDGAMGMLQGTSFAAPVVSGIVARILSTDPTLDAIEIRNILLNTAQTDAFTAAGQSNGWGYGKADLSVGGAPLPSTLRVDPDVLPNGVLDEQYDFVLTGSGGVLPFSWSLAGGILPSGLGLGADGLLSGAPTASGVFGIIVQLTDSSFPPKVTTRSYSMAVVATGPLHVPTQSLPVARIELPYQAQIEIEGGIPPHSFSVIGGGLPPGLSLHADGGIDGSPSSLGEYSFTVRVFESVTALSLYRSFKIRVTGRNGDDWDPLGKAVSTVSLLAVDPSDTDHLLASTSVPVADVAGIVFETTNGGDFWADISTHNTVNKDAYQIAFNPADSRPWIIRRRTSLFELDTSSGQWIFHNMGSDPYVAPPAYVFDFDAAGNVYVVGEGEYAEERSTYVFDRSAGTWSQLGHLCFSFLSGGEVTSLSVPRQSPLVMYSSGYSDDINSPGGKVCRSDNGGASWVSIMNGSHGWVGLQVSQTDPMDVIKAFSTNYLPYDPDNPDPPLPSGTYVERSIDGGRSWQAYRVTGTSDPRHLYRSPSDPSLVLLPTSHGLFRSTDHAQTWSEVEIDGALGTPTGALAVDPQNPDEMYLNTGMGVLHTTDGGATWSRTNGDGLRKRESYDIAASPTSGQLLLLAPEGPYLSRTTGDAWTLGDTGMGSVRRLARALARVAPSDPSRYYVVLSDVTSDGHVFASENSGVTWSEPDPGFSTGYGVVALDVDPFDANRLIASQSGSRGTFRSLDGGASWTAINTGLPFYTPNDVAFARDVADRVFISFTNNGGVYQSTNGGDSWTAIGLNTEIVRLIRPAPSDSDYVYAVGFLKEVWYFDPAVGTWQAPITPVPEKIDSLAVHPTNPAVAFVGADWGGATDTGGLYKTTDGGRNWVRLAGVLDAFDVVSIAIDPGSPDVMYAATRTGGVYRSTNGGSAWVQLDNYGTVADLTNINLPDPTNPFLLFAGTDGYGVQVSADNGVTFEPRVSGLGNLFVNALAFDPDTPTTVYAGTDEGVFKSPDSGNSWSATDLASGVVTDLAAGNVGSAKLIWATVDGEGVAVSQDGGATFDLSTTGLASLQLTGVEVEETGTAKLIWVTMKGGDGVAVSEDLGQTWQSAAGNGLTDRNVNDVTVDAVAKLIWVTTDNGVFSSADGGLGWTERSTGLPQGIPVTSVALDPNTGEAFVSLFSDTGGGVYRGGNLHGVWSEFNGGLRELKVKKLSRDQGGQVDPTTFDTAFYAATFGDGVYRAQVRTALAERPRIATSALPSAALQGAYAYSLRAIRGTPPYTWSLVSGSLPAGLRLEQSTGSLHGAPGQTGVFSFTARVLDANAAADQRDLVLVVRGAGIFADDFESGDATAWSRVLGQ